MRSPLSATYPEQHLFETSSQHFAAALIATHLLEYSHARLHENGRETLYIFLDPELHGREYLRQYWAQTFPLVHASTLAQAIKLLVKEKMALRANGGGAQ